MIKVSFFDKNILRLTSIIFSISTFAFSTSAVAEVVPVNEAQGPFTASTDADWAVSCIDFLFHGTTLPESLSQYGERLTPLGDALRHALSIYSMAMLVLAGIVLFYHLIAIVADTAQQGVILGRKTNQIWAPIRLAVAVILLAPIGSGLSAGQQLVLKIATSGSNLASNAWQELVGAVSDDFSLLVMPRGPDTSELIAATTEMELCRLIYEQIYTSLQNDHAVHIAGSMGDIVKIPATRTNFETWRYSNVLNASTPLCGEYRFNGYRRHGLVTGPYTDSIARISDDLATFSHNEADNLMTQSRSIALRVVSVFVTGDTPSVLNIQSDLDALNEDTKKRISSHLLTIASINANLAAKYMARPAEAGWISSGFFIPELIRMQESYGEMVGHMMPEVQGPIFSHLITTEAILSDTISMDPILRNLDHSISENISRFYVHISRLNTRATNWIEDTQISENNNLPITGFDLLDQLTMNYSTDAGYSLFEKSLDIAAINRGVWGAGVTDTDPGNPFAAVGGSKIYNPLAVVIEYGRRQWGLGEYLMGLAGGLSAFKQDMGPMIASIILGVCFLGGGFVLLLLSPLLPFVRFLLAVLTWLLELFEALAAMPIVSLAHITPSGDGISGSLARQAYMLWIGLAVRPILTLFGLVIGLLLFTLGISFVEIALTPLARLANSSNTSILIVANVSVVLIFDVLVFAVANVAFKGIYSLPDQALRWISPFVVTDGLTPSNSNPPTNAGSSQFTHGSVGSTSIPSTGRSSSSTSGNSTSGGTNMLSSLFPVTHKESTSSTSTMSNVQSTTTMSSNTAAFPVPTTGSSTSYTEVKNIASPRADYKGQPPKENQTAFHNKAHDKPDGNPKN